MLTKKILRRNTVVSLLSDESPFYGRVIRMLPDGYVLWLSGGLHFYISHESELEVLNYKGKMVSHWHHGKGCFIKRFWPMTTLRHLKKRAQRYHYEYAHNTPLDYHFIKRSSK